MFYRKPIEHNYTIETRLSCADTVTMQYLTNLLILYGQEKRYILHHIDDNVADSEFNDHTSRNPPNSFGGGMRQ